MVPDAQIGAKDLAEIVTQVRPSELCSAVLLLASHRSQAKPAPRQVKQEPSPQLLQVLLPPTSLLCLEYSGQQALTEQPLAVE